MNFFMMKRSTFYNYIVNKSSFGHCWHKKVFYFHKQIKSTIFDILCFVCAFVYILKRWQAYLQKWFLNASGYFWFITWWHVKKSSKNFFLICLFKKLKFCVIPWERICVCMKFKWAFTSFIFIQPNWFKLHYS